MPLRKLKNLFRRRSNPSQTAPKKNQKKESSPEKQLEYRPEFFVDEEETVALHYRPEFFVDDVPPSSSPIVPKHRPEFFVDGETDDCYTRSTCSATRLENLNGDSSSADAFKRQTAEVQVTPYNEPTTKHHDRWNVNVKIFYSVEENLLSVGTSDSVNQRSTSWREEETTMLIPQRRLYSLWKRNWWYRWWRVYWWLLWWLVLIPCRRRHRRCIVLECLFLLFCFCVIVVLFCFCVFALTYACNLFLCWLLSFCFCVPFCLVCVLFSSFSGASLRRS